MARYTYSVPVINGKLARRITIHKKEKIYYYMVYPDKHVFTTNKYHVELKDYLIHKEED